MEYVSIDWGEVFRLDASIPETIIRGSVLYLATFVLMRLFLRRSVGELNMLDFVFILLVANAATNGMTGDHRSVTNGIVLVATLVAWEYGLNVLSYHSRIVERMIMPPQVLIVRDGAPLRRAMRREFLTMDELLAQMRAQGYEDLAEVRRAYLEADGTVSVIPYDADHDQSRSGPAVARRFRR